MSDIKWEKRDGHCGVWMNRGCCAHTFTVAELQEGLRVAQEKPVYEAVSSMGRRWEYQKRGNTVFARDASEWLNAEDMRVGGLSDDELGAFTKARRS